MAQARRINAIIKYNNKDISTDINPYIKSISYRDVMSGQADDLQLTLEDRQGLWQSAWFPDKGATLDVSLVTSGWKSAEALLQTLKLGTFELDEIGSSGYPSEVQLKAVSVPFNNTLRGEEHTRSWEKAELKTIANDIASASKLDLFFDTDYNPTIERAEQTEQSDLSFLLGLCGDYGLALKISSGQLIIFDELKYETAEPLLTIVKPGTIYIPADNMIYLPAVTAYNLTTKLRDIYAACRVSYQQGKNKAIIEATFTVPGKTGKTLQVKEQVENVADAERLAKKRLREKNRDEVTGSINLPGSFYLVAGITINLLGFGSYDGKYIITEAQHDAGNGYTTSINIRRCLNGY